MIALASERLKNLLPDVISLDHKRYMSKTSPRKKGSPNSLSDRLIHNSNLNKHISMNNEKSSLTKNGTKEN